MFGLFSWKETKDTLPPNTLQLINQKLDRILSLIDRPQPPPRCPSPSLSPNLLLEQLRYGDKHDNPFISELNHKISDYRERNGMGILGTSTYL